MEKTNQELKDELLIAYRLHFSALYANDRQRESISRLKKQLKEAEKDADDELNISQNLRERNRELNEDLTESVLDVWRCREALDAALDLIGAVVENEAANDQATHDLLTYFRTGGEVATTQPTRVEQPSVGLRQDGGPLRCLSCNDDKEEDFYYICERCFELDNEYDLNLFGDLMRDWDNGHRDFPRAGKNAKELIDTAKELIVRSDTR